MEGLWEKEEFYYPSADRKTQIHGVLYKPCEQPVMILQIAHGMVERIEAYEEFAVWLAKRGVAVTGNDHLGHGKSISSPKEYGYFARQKGFEKVLQDMEQLQARMKKRYAKIPYFLMGHSMGSFFARVYMARHSKELSGVILMGTGTAPKFLLDFGRLYAKVLGKLRGDHFISRFLIYMSIGKYNRAYSGRKTPFEWISTNEKYIGVMLMNQQERFDFTVNAYDGMFACMQEGMKWETMQKVRKDLPILFSSGAEDQVGGCGKGVAVASRKYRQLGVRDVTVKLYPKLRHDLLHEKTRQDIFADLYEWLIEKGR